MASYRETHERIDLVNAYLNLMAPASRLRWSAVLGQEFPWSDGPAKSCSLADPSAYIDEIRFKAHEALAKAERYSDPKDAEVVTTEYGDLVKGVFPDFEFQVANGWWQELFYLDMNIAETLAVFDTYEMPALPTRDEARFLIAMKLNASRSLYLEPRLEYVLDDVENERDWESEPITARRAYAVTRVEWALTRAQCIPVE